MAGLRNSGVDTSAWYLPGVAGTELLLNDPRVFDAEGLFGGAMPPPGLWAGLYGMYTSGDPGEKEFQDWYGVVFGEPDSTYLQFADVQLLFFARAFIDGAVREVSDAVDGVSKAVAEISDSPVDTDLFLNRDYPLTTASIGSGPFASLSDCADSVTVATAEPADGETVATFGNTDSGVTGYLKYYRRRVDWSSPAADPTGLGFYLTHVDLTDFTITYYPTLAGSESSLLEACKSLNTGFGATSEIGAAGAVGCLNGGITEKGNIGVHGLPLLPGERYLVDGDISESGISDPTVPSELTILACPVYPGLWYGGTDDTPTGDVQLYHYNTFSVSNADLSEAVFSGTPLVFLEGPTSADPSEFTKARVPL